MADGAKTIKVNITVVCKFYTGGFGGAECEVAQGSTVLDAFNQCLEEGGAKFKGDIPDITMCMRNGRQARYTDTVEDGDVVLIIRKVFGG